MAAESTSLSLALTFLGKHIRVVMDRPLGSHHPREGFVYEANYGFVPGTSAPDGAELDAYYLGVQKSLTEAEGRCIAIIHRFHDDDDKLVIVPDGMKMDVPDIASAVRFQEQWFEHEIIPMSEDD